MVLLEHVSKRYDMAPLFAARKLRRMDVPSTLRVME
jgi:hypothetical protein